MSIVTYPRHILIILAVGSSTASSDWTLAATIGVTAQSTKTAEQAINDKVCAYQKFLNDWTTYKKNQLTEGEDFMPIDPTGALGYIVGFGADVNEDRKFDSVDKKLQTEHSAIISYAKNEFATDQWDVISDVAANVEHAQRSEGANKYYGKLNWAPVYLCEKENLAIRIKIMNGIDHIPYSAFANGYTLQKAIVDYRAPNYAEIISAYTSATKLKSQTRSGMTFGISMAYSHSFFSKERYECGIYTGVEGFGEMTPKAVSGGCTVRETEVGIRPFVGIEMKEKWRLYILGGVKLRRMNIKSKLFEATTNKPAFELGLGSEYIISDRYSIGLKVIKTLKQRHKIKGLPLTTTSLKILFSFGIRF